MITFADGTQYENSTDLLLDIPVPAKTQTSQQTAGLTEEGSEFNITGTRRRIQEDRSNEDLERWMQDQGVPGFTLPENTDQLPFIIPGTKTPRGTVISQTMTDETPMGLGTTAMSVKPPDLFAKPGRGVEGGGTGPTGAGNPGEVRREIQGYRLWDNVEKRYIGNEYKPNRTQRRRLQTRADKMDNEYGAYRYQVRPQFSGDE